MDVVWPNRFELWNRFKCWCKRGFSVAEHLDTRLKEYVTNRIRDATQRTGYYWGCCRMEPCMWILPCLLACSHDQRQKCLILWLTQWNGYWRKRVRHVFFIIWMTSSLKHQAPVSVRNTWGFYWLSLKGWISQWPNGKVGGTNNSFDMTGHWDWHLELNPVLAPV